MKSLLVILAVCLSIALGEKREACPLSTYSDTCEFYKCVEGETNCGNSGYPIGYGYKYCNKFTARLSKFNAAGQNFVTCTRQCLIRVLYSNSFGKNNFNCNSVKSLSFDSHPDCYISCGFCNIAVDNMSALWSIYEVSDLFSFSALKQMASTAARCSASLATQFAIRLMSVFG